MSDNVEFREEKRIRTIAINSDDTTQDIDVVFSYNAIENTIKLIIAGIEIFKADWEGNFKEFFERMSDYFS